MASDDKLYDLVIQWDERRQQGEELPAAALCTDCPELIPALEERIASVKATDWLLDDDDEDDDFLSLPPQLTKKRFSVPESVSLDQFSESIVVSGVLTSEELQQVDADSANVLAGKLIGSKRLTEYQAKLIAEGNTKGLVLGNYVILDKIGAGGMGQVFKARHKRMKRIVALKTLPDKAVESATALERFHREVEAAARLEHPNVVTAFDADEFDGQHFLVMQHVDGDDLSSLVRKKGPMSVGHAVDCIIQAAKGLEYAHRKGVVHRDIKPANLLLDEDGTVKVLDLGLARFERTNGSNGFAITESELTTNGVVLGTVDYLAPEQALDTHSADGRSDIYSLGCTLHFLLTGKPVFTGSTLMAKMLAHREKEIPSLRDERDDVPERLEAIYEKMIAKKPDDRYATMTALLEDLESVATECEDTWKGDKSTVIEPDSDLASRETSSSELSDTLVMPPAVEAEPTPEVVAESSGSGRRIFAGGLAVLLLAGFGYWLFGILFSVETPDGIIQVETNVTDVDVFVDNTKVVHITDPKDNKKISVSIPKGAKMLRVAKEGFEADVKEFRLKTVKGPIRVSFVPLQKPVVGGDQHRAVAEWVCKHGGNVDLNVSGEQFHATTIAELPDDAFAVEGIGVGYVPDFNDDDLAELHRLGRGTDLLQLGLSGTAITDQGLAHLEGFPNLESLDLAATAISDEGLRHLASLQKLRNLSIQLCSNYTDLGMMHLAGLTALERLDLSEITDGGIIHLANLNNLTFLSLNRCDLSDVGLKRISEQFPKLHGLNLIDTPQCTDAGLEHLGKLHNLQYLYLVRTGVSGTGLKHLKHLAKLETLHLGDSAVSDESLLSLVELKHLRTLTLNSTQVSDTAIEQLTRMEKLERLGLEKTKVTAQGVAKLQKALPTCKIEWDGSRDQATSVAPMEKDKPEDRSPHKDREVAETLLDLGAVLNVNVEGVGGPNLRVERRDQLPETDFKLVYVSIDPEKLTGIHATLLHAAHNLVEVGLAGTLSKERLAVLPSQETLTGVALECNVNDEDLSFLSDMSHLKQVWLIRGEFSDNGVAKLAKIPSLQDLKIVGGRVTGDCFDQRHGWGASLTVLDLKQCDITDDTLKTIADRPGITRMVMWNLAHLTPDGIEHLGQMKKLLSLDMEGVCVTDSWMEKLRGTHLSSIALTNTSVSNAGLDNLKQLKSLAVLKVHNDNPKITEEGIAALREALPNCEITR